MQESTPPPFSEEENIASTPKSSSFRLGFSEINHPAIGYPHLWKPPFKHPQTKQGTSADGCHVQRHPRRRQFKRAQGASCWRNRKQKTT